MIVLADNTGCSHEPVDRMGVHQCRLCGRTFQQVAGALVIDASVTAPECEQCSEVLAMLPALEENSATKGVARKLRSIYGDIK